MERTESVFTKRNYMVYEKILNCRGRCYYNANRRQSYRVHCIVRGTTQKIKGLECNEKKHDENNKPVTDSIMD